MADRSIFNRRYSSFTPGNTEVWLTNGAGVTTTPSKTQSFTAGSNLIQGQPVYVSGVYVFPATAASGITSDRYNVIGITATAANIGSSISVNLDDIVTVTSSSITADSFLTPGVYYYLSKYSGQLTRFSTASGSVSASGGYGAVVNLGLALSTTELQVEIEQPVIIYG